MAGDAGFYFKTNPLTLETTQTKHQHLNYSPVFSLLGHLLYTSSPRFPRASRSWSQGPSYRPTLLEGQGCQQRLSVTRTLAPSDHPPPGENGDLNQPQKEAKGSRACEMWPSPQETCSSSGVLGSTPHLRPICSPHWKEARVPGMMGLTRSHLEPYLSWSSSLSLLNSHPS